MKATHIAAVERVLLARVEAGADALGSDSPWLRFQSWKMRGGRVGELQTLLPAAEEIQVGAEHDSLAGHLDRLWQLERGMTLSDAASGIIVMPSEVAAMLKNLDADSKRLNEAWLALNKATVNATPDFQTAFLGWQQTFANIQAYIASDPSTWWGATADQVDSYRTELVKWEKELESRKGKLSGPPIAPIDGGLEPPSLPGTSFAVPLAIGAAVALGVVVYLKR
jgi:hypothetical protein